MGGDCGKWIIIPESNICSIQNSSSLGSSQHPLVTPGLLSYQDSIVLYFWPHLPHLYSHMSLAHPQMTCLYINIISVFTSSCKRTHVSWCEHHGYLFPIHLRVVTSIGTIGRTERGKKAFLRFHSAQQMTYRCLQSKNETGATSQRTLRFLSADNACHAPSHILSLVLINLCLWYGTSSL